MGTDGDYATDTIYSWSNLTSCPKNTTAYEGNGSLIKLANKDIIAAPSLYGCNIWRHSKLNTINLNTNYLNKIGLIWGNIIEDTTWKIGGYSGWNFTAKEVLSEEITNVTETYGPSEGISKIGLMYVSDYGFAASQSAWTTIVRDYGSSSITSVNWLYLGTDEWTITLYAGSSNDAFYLTSDGNPSYYSVCNAYDIRPSFYLKNSVTYSSGDGPISNPFRIN